MVRVGTNIADVLANNNNNNGNSVDDNNNNNSNNNDTNIDNFNINNIDGRNRTEPAPRYVLLLFSIFLSF